MLKNLNDYLSFITIIVFLLYILRILISTIFPRRVTNTFSKQLEEFYNYDENEDE